MREEKVPVCIFAKPPVPGEVKTRLAAVIGAQAAARLAAAMLCDVWEEIASSIGVRAILATGGEGPFPETLAEVERWPQGEGDLGERMERILRRGLGEAEAAIVIGADVPLLSKAHIAEAVRELRSKDAVIGPSDDGGFYLLGLRRCPQGLLKNLPWSAAETHSRTRARLEACGFSIAELSSLADVDVADDLGMLQSACSQGESPAVRTRMVLRSLPIG